jgi:hypothetical protein
MHGTALGLRIGTMEYLHLGIWHTEGSYSVQRPRPLMKLILLPIDTQLIAHLQTFTHDANSILVRS